MVLLKDIERFIVESQKLKDEHRRGWKLKAGIKSPESVADHTYGVAMLSMLLADKMGLDAEKCIKMALLHDLSEVITGDLMPGENNNKREEDNIAMRRLLKLLPDKLARQYLAIWNDFRLNKSKEALLVHELDKLEMVIQAYRYKGQGTKKELLTRFADSARAKISDKQVRTMFDEFAAALK